MIKDKLYYKKRDELSDKLKSVAEMESESSDGEWGSYTEWDTLADYILENYERKEIK